MQGDPDAGRVVDNSRSGEGLEESDDTLEGESYVRDRPTFYKITARDTDRDRSKQAKKRARADPRQKQAGAVSKRQMKKRAEQGKLAAEVCGSCEV